MCFDGRSGGGVEAARVFGSIMNQELGQDLTMKG